MRPWRRSELILASASPRRAELLAGLGLSFQVVPSAYEERHEDRPGDPAELVRTLAAGKAWEVARAAGRGLVLGADTVVILAGAVLEKPADTHEARKMLGALSGQWHEVYTGVALVEASACRSMIGHERTRVKFGNLTPAVIDAYVETGEPMDKAGAYGIQGRGAVLVERIDGCYTNVVGLPLSLLAAMLREFGLEVLQPSRSD